MGSGGGFFAPIAQVIGDVVNSVSKAVGGSDHVMSTPASQRQDMQKMAQQQAESRAKTQEAQSGEGGTPSAYASQQARSAAGSAAALSGSQQAVNQSAGSGTMLTGNEGVNPESLELGRKTLLGG